MITFCLALFYFKCRALYSVVSFPDLSLSAVCPCGSISTDNVPQAAAYWLSGFVYFPCLSASKNKTFSFRRGDCQSFFALGWTAENTFVMFLKISDGSSEFTNGAGRGSVWTSAAGLFKRGLFKHSQKNKPTTPEGTNRSLRLRRLTSLSPHNGFMLNLPAVS